jgi:hypothetical protein
LMSGGKVSAPMTIRSRALCDGSGLGMSCSSSIGRGSGIDRARTITPATASRANPACVAAWGRLVRAASP